MYCFEAHKCTKYDCPVQKWQVKRCWKFLEEKNKHPVTTEECPYAPCERCNYKLGWEIGLIGEGMFPDNPDPTPESILPEKKEETSSKTVETEGTDVKLDEYEDEFDRNSEPDINKIKSDTQELDSKTISETLIDTKTKIVNETEDDALVGQKGLRFCYEILDCPNPNCVVRRRQIIQCYSYFSRKGHAKKAEMTCSERKCEDCFVKRGWDIGTLDESMFKDVLEKKRLKIVKNDSIKRNSLVEMYLSELAKKPLSRKEEIELAKKIAGDKDASELFLLANLKLVMRVAKQFPKKGLGLMDLIQEGNIGLIKAISKFDYTLGYRFSTYAAYWIRYYMQKAVSNQGSTIRVPHHLLTVAHKIRKRISEYEYQFYKSPTLSELSKMMEISEDKILDIIRITQTPISLQAKTSEDSDDDSPEYYLSDKNQLTPEEEALERLKNDAVRDAVKLLNERLQYIVFNFYGFEDEYLSLAEIGRRLGISRERVRQLLRQALHKLSESELIINLEN